MYTNVIWKKVKSKYIYRYISNFCNTENILKHSLYLFSSFSWFLFIFLFSWFHYVTKIYVRNKERQTLKTFQGLLPTNKNFSVKNTYVIFKSFLNVKFYLSCYLKFSVSVDLFNILRNLGSIIRNTYKYYRFMNCKMNFLFQHSNM